MQEEWGLSSDGNGNGNSLNSECDSILPLVKETYFTSVTLKETWALSLQSVFDNEWSNRFLNDFQVEDSFDLLGARCYLNHDGAYHALIDFQTQRLGPAEALFEKNDGKLVIRNFILFDYAIITIN
jgi:hypothetical protein